MELIAFAGTDKENWGQIAGLIKRGEWDNVVIVKSKSADDFPKPNNGEVVTVNSELPLLELKKELWDKLKPKLKDFEVALSIASGSGKEHMALISALLTIPVGIRLVVFTKNGVEYIN